MTTSDPSLDGSDGNQGTTDVQTDAPTGSGYTASGGITPAASAPPTAAPFNLGAFLSGPVGLGLGVLLAGALAYFAYPYVAKYLVPKKGKKS